MNHFDYIAGGYDKFMKFFRFYKPELLIQHLQPDSDDTVIDIAGGTGYLANKIKPHVNKMVLLDASSKMLNEAKQHEGITLCHADSDNIPFKDESFEAAMCIDALHHLKKPDKTLAETARILKSGGKIVILEIKPSGLSGIPMYLFEKIFFRAEFITPENLLKRTKELHIPGEIVKISGLEYLFVGTKE